MVEAQVNAIQATLDEYPLCLQIIRFLLEHQNAMDTLRGISACWVASDEPAVQAALDRLIQCGTLITHRRRSGTLYALTPDVAVRDWLRTSVGDIHKLIPPVSPELAANPVQPSA